MGRIVVSEFVSLDGVMEDPGGSEGTRHAGWTFRFDRGPEGGRFKLDEVLDAEAQLLGRVTYAVHSDALSAAETDWRQILILYDQLVALDSSPVVALNRAVALAEVEGADAGLAALDGLSLETYYLLHAVRADLLRRLGRLTEATAAYDAARALTDNEAEQDFLERARDATAGPPRQ